MSEFTKGELTTDGQDSIRIAGTEVAHMCSNFDWTVRRATAKELVRRWNEYPDLLNLCKEFMEKADDGSADFDDPEPGSIYLRAEAAIKKAQS